LWVAGDRAIDFNTVAEAQGGVEFGDLAEDADFLRGQIDVPERSMALWMVASSGTSMVSQICCACSE